MDFPLPQLGEGVYEAELVDWKVQPGQAVRRGQILLEVLTDKATMEVPSPFTGTITAVHGEPGQQIKVGQVILVYTPAGTAAPAKEKEDGVAAEPVAAAPAVARRPNGVTPSAVPLKAAPSVRYLARQLGIDLAGVGGSGPEGRILLSDLSALLQKPGQPRPREVEPVPDYGKPGTRLKLVGLRRKIAERMVLSKQTIPHYGYVEECDVTDLVHLREALRETFAEAGVKLTYLAFFVKAVAGALADVPLVNASLDEPAGEIVLHDRYDIGIAVAIPGGLIVPVVRDANQKDLTQLARDIERLSSEARAGKARLEDLRGATFTVSSIGNLGGLFSTPVINPPEVGILGLGKIVKRPVFDEAGQVKPADMIYLSFSFDHRVLDGAVGAAFGNALVRRLSTPASLLLPALSAASQKR
jgi:pyruvate dehydrogenase E2 component (dihydrolipoamide acetyltransferase)/2-oxoisovalerate dehydrogenase E2 component (dihydrolipoyl transacylase)